jgi:hypothetical protein
MGLGLGKLLAEQGPFDLVIIMAGTNDLAMPQYSAEEAVASLKKMHKACWATGTATVALSVPESTVTGTAQYPEAQRKWHAVNNALAAWAKAEQSERFKGLVNSAKLLPFDQSSRMRGLWDPDSLHFSAAGSREFGSKLAPIVASHLKEKTGLPQILESNDSSPEPESPTKRRRTNMPTKQTMTTVSEGPRTVTRTITADKEGLHKAPSTPDKPLTRTMTADSEGLHRAPLTPEKKNVVARIDRATSAGQNCGIRFGMTPVQGAGVSSAPLTHRAGVSSAPLTHRPMQQPLRFGRVH